MVWSPIYDFFFILFILLTKAVFDFSSNFTGRIALEQLNQILSFNGAETSYYRNVIIVLCGENHFLECLSNLVLKYITLYRSLKKNYGGSTVLWFGNFYILYFPPPIKTIVWKAHLETPLQIATIFRRPTTHRRSLRRPRQRPSPTTPTPTESRTYYSSRTGPT